MNNLKRQIENKIQEIIKYILNKNPKEITYEEYQILYSHLKDLRFEEDILNGKNNE